MDSILMAIQPKHCWNIFRGIKTIKVRKHIPKNRAPFKVHIYCTSIKSMNLQDYCEIHKFTGGIIDDWNGKVIGEFVCDYVEKFSYDYLHISDLKIYDKPKELSDFGKFECKDCGPERECLWKCDCGFISLKRPPRSWCYVRELKGE